MAGLTAVPDTGRRSPPGNLPAELSSFVGRDRELLELKRLLAVTHTVTLIGPGGIGKSRLALRAAGALGPHFPEGVWLVKVATLESAELLSNALAGSLGVYERGDAGIEEAVLDHLRERRMLLVFDNCDSFLEACRELTASIVSRCSGVRVLCTSRQRLGVEGEAVVAVAPLGLPAATERVSLAAVADAEALRLLVDRAQAVAPTFELTEENCAAASDICRRLDGLPLAIELAAVRLASMTPDDLLERLDDRFQLLAFDRGQEPPRHAALQATVEWSHELLDEHSQILWRRLSVFAGSFSLAAAEAVCSGDGLEQGKIIGLIGRLVDRSILTMAPSGGRGRYRFLETIRLYGAERLREAGEEGTLRRRHAEWYAQLISGGEQPRSGTAGLTGSFDVLDVEWANVEAALDFFIESDADAPRGLRVAADLWLYWVARGRYRLGRRHLENLLAAAPEFTPTRAMALWASAFFAQAIGDHEAARAGFEEAQHVSAQIGAGRELGYALFGLGLVHLRMGELQPALEALEASREQMQEVEDARGRSMGLYFLATVLAGMGQLPEAFRLAEEGLEVSEAGGDLFGRGNLLSLLGILDWLLDDVGRAEARLKESARTLHRVGERWGMTTAVEGLAWVSASTSRFERSALLLGSAASLWQELGFTLAPYWQGYHEACEAATRRELGAARFTDHWEKGFALSRRAALAAALEESAPEPEGASAVAAEAGGFELTERELEVARLVANGLSNPAIAAKLFVSRATVKTHVSHVLRKLALDSRVQLANWVAAHDPAAPSTPAPR